MQSCKEGSFNLQKNLINLNENCPKFPSERTGPGSGATSVSIPGKLFYFGSCSADQKILDPVGSESAKIRPIKLNKNKEIPTNDVEISLDVGVDHLVP
jgi:hypothetical protein